MDGESMAKVVQTRLVVCSIHPDNLGHLPDALEGFIHVPNAHPLAIAFDKERCVVVLCLSGLMPEGDVLTEFLIQQFTYRDQSGSEKLGVTDGEYSLPQINIGQIQTERLTKPQTRPVK